MSYSQRERNLLGVHREWSVCRGALRRGWTICLKPENGILFGATDPKGVWSVATAHGLGHGR
jgi:hypothetical protein